MTTLETPPTTFLWLELTGKCQLECTHCYAGSGPSGTHGTMTVADWQRVVAEGAAMGVRTVQFIGGEPTLHDGLPELITYALDRSLTVEVFSNLVHVTARLWAAFDRPGVTLATSYYSDDPDQHAAITGHPTHARTRANIAEARRRGIPLRAGVIDLGPGQRVTQAEDELVQLGVPVVGRDRLRGIGRGSRGGAVVGELCGQCGDGVAAVGPDGSVRPCVFTRWMSVGNVREDRLVSIGQGLPGAREALVRQGMRAGAPCRPIDDGTNCWPHNDR